MLPEFLCGASHSSCLYSVLIKKFIIYFVTEPPSPALGISLHPDGYLPFGDPNTPPESLGAAFGNWVRRGDINFFSPLNILLSGVKLLQKWRLR